MYSQILDILWYIKRYEIWITFCEWVKPAHVLLYLVSYRIFLKAWNLPFFGATERESAVNLLDSGHFGPRIHGLGGWSWAMRSRSRRTNNWLSSPGTSPVWDIQDLVRVGRAWVTVMFADHRGKTLIAGYEWIWMDMVGMLKQSDWLHQVQSLHIKRKGDNEVCSCSLRLLFIVKIP